MAPTIFDPFEALGLERNASGPAIKQRYHALARKYHPNRHQRDQDSTTCLSTEHFHRIHQAWKLLSKTDSRRRRVELLNLLELQDEMLTHFIDLFNTETPAEARQEKHDHSDLDGNTSSDADEDLPSVGLQRRQTFANRNAHNTHLAHLGDQQDAAGPNSPTAPTKKTVRIVSKLVRSSPEKAEKRNGADYFTLRRKKLEKLRRKELEAFIDYRNAMVTKFEAEEEAERRQEHFERAKWRREYFERAPRGTTERLRSLYRLTGAVTAFEENAAPRRRGPSDGAYGLMTPVVGPGEGGSQFLFPDSQLSRSKSVHHRRAWSSDISGDQSDSEDDSGDANARNGGRWFHHSRQVQESLSFDAFREFANKPTPSRKDSNTPFKLIVRQPTDLATIRETQQDSSEDSSSRSPSPHPPSPIGTETTKFQWLPSSSPSRAFGVPADRNERERSPSPAPDRRTSSPHSLGRMATQIAEDGCHFTMKQVGAPHHLYIPMEHVHLLNRSEKARALGAEFDTEHSTPPAVLLERLRQLDQNVASKFIVKPDYKDRFNFRLIYGYRQIATKQDQSFIALSYRRKLHVNKTDTHYTLPLEPEMFQAVWEERQPDEGLWIDQICIEQGNREETTMSMSAMDLVYASARMVIVALDDIELDAHEGELLQNHMKEYQSMTHVAPRQRFRRKQPPYLETREPLFRVIRKMLRSSWFKRAWCRHEMRLAKHHTFLIPCKKPGTWSGRDVLKFNGKTMSHLLDLSTEVPFESDVESVKPALHAFFRDRSKMAADERRMQLHHGNFSTVVAEVFAMDAGGDPNIPEEQRQSDARKDKIAIVLNTMECGIAIEERFRDPSVQLLENDCYHDLILLSLAAQDPGALCSVGAPLPITNSTYSWIYKPTVADAGLNNTKQLQRLPEKARFVADTSGPEHCIQLDVNILKSGRRERPHIDPDSIALARTFIGVCEERKWGRNRKRYLIQDRKANLLFGPMQEFYEETLACVFTCGPDWMSDVCQRYSMSRWKVDLQGAYELLVALANTYGRWPAEAWSERAAGFIMDFVNFLVVRGLPQRQISKPEKWRPFWVTTALGGKVLTFIPIGIPNIQAAIPTALINADYVHLARLWILEPRQQHHNNTPSADHVDDDDNNLLTISNTEWTLLGKSVIFSDEPSIGQMTAFGGEVLEQQRVYGRHRVVQANGAFVKEEKSLQRR